MISIKLVKKSRKALLKINEIEKRVKHGIMIAFHEIARDLKKEIRREILKGKKTGRIYIKKLNGRSTRHRASAPGETAANFSGGYYNSIDTAVKGGNKLDFGAKLVGGKKYPAYLESGTKVKGKVRMKKRPGLKNAIDAKKAETQEYLRNHILRQIRK